MSDFVKLENIKSFTPFQHELQVSEPLESVKAPPNDKFETQVSNIRFIMSNTLDNSELKRISDKAMIPDETSKVMYNEIAQKQLEKAMYEMRGKKFSKDYDEVPDEPKL